MGRSSRRLPVEEPAAALTGYKLAQVLLAADGSAVAFTGMSIGSYRMYKPVDEAVCVFNKRHQPPHHRGDCGFYCVYTAEQARALGADNTYRGGVLLEVSASGRFIRYEEGLRYQRQRVRAVRIGLCGCGRRAEGFVDAGEGKIGWRRLQMVCGVCAGHRPQVTPAHVGKLLPGVPVTLDEGARPIDELPLPSGAGEESDGAKVAILSAEIALLQARLDSVQSRLASLENTDPRPRPAD